MMYITGNNHPALIALAKVWGVQHKQNELVTYFYDVTDSQADKLNLLSHIL